MKIYRGNVGVELSLGELSHLLQDDEQIDDLLNLIYELEMDEAMNYNEDDIQKFEEQLFEEVAEYQQKQKHSDDEVKMKRILEHLKKYGR
ncbi:hypothetical protein [Cytobacillus oceanisediminis]|uniref:hypothetical protein n=1 Tax=Cytobacillus oceanisediminis TaxID=665099 RepID=UPI001FB3688E|nr:hypothetical protein [Cytobacillus oceanisediminis]UOE58206.1 hypothetical protein IRB79_27275 [Cytobacillus oceanisediminis]